MQECCVSPADPDVQKQTSIEINGALRVLISGEKFLGEQQSVTRILSSLSVNISLKTLCSAASDELHLVESSSRLCFSQSLGVSEAKLLLSAAQ